MSIYYKLTSLKKDEIKRFNNEFNRDKKIMDKCYRCGSKLINEVCNNCNEFGKVKKGDEFYSLQYTDHLTKYQKVKKELRLTKLQQEASDFIIKNKQLENDVLIWAVCGAGKTEITFLAIEDSLIKSKYIAFAIPRIDILYDVAERLKWFFPNVDICILNSKEKKIQDGQIYVMTTNQILKFKNCFDLIIVDEVDAFPYEFNEKYDYGVRMSKRKGGIIVYLTSTPSNNMLNKKVQIFEISRRWHNCDLPVPKFEKLYIELFDYNIVPLKIRKIISSYDKQQLWFVSNIKLCEKVCGVIKRKYPNIKIEYVYSNDDKRREKIIAFSNEEINILITTTILERGVTFKNIDVYILDSSNTYYNIASLVQIAGRVGRNKDYQEGKVVFFHFGITKVMEEAKSQIQYMNKK